VVRRDGADLPDDDPLARLRWLRRPVNAAFLLLIGTQQLTIRVKLDWRSAPVPAPQLLQDVDGSPKSGA
jgi:hypothetical protein